MMIGFWQLVIILVVVLLIFGTSKLRNVGKDLGGAIKEFRSSVTDSPDEDKKQDEKPAAASTDNKEAE
jgi:sec-independent protein translocase protein TatA